MLRLAAYLCSVALVTTSAVATPAVVALQPFTMDDDGDAAPPSRSALRAASLPRRSSGIVRAELVRETSAIARADAPMQVAYYVPNTTRQAQPSYEDYDSDYDTEPQSNGIDVGGSHPTVPGDRAVLHNGIAYAPANAPLSVKQAIWAVNTIRTRPYIWGGGHSSFNDYGYDCSGTVSFALHYAGVLDRPLPSTDFLRYGEYGRGRWITIYSRNGHAFAMIAGLRLDTTDFQRGGNEGPRWHTDSRSTWGFEARHPSGL